MIAHELAHIVQQSRYPDIYPNRHYLETEADRQADLITRRRSVIPAYNVENNGLTPATLPGAAPAAVQEHRSSLGTYSAKPQIQFYNFFAQYDDNPAIYLDYPTTEFIRTLLRLGVDRARSLFYRLIESDTLRGELQEALGEVDMDIATLKEIVFSQLWDIGIELLGVWNRMGNGIIIVIHGISAPVPIQIIPRSSVIVT